MLYLRQSELFNTMHYPDGESHSILKPTVGITRMQRSADVVIEAKAVNFEDLAIILVQNDILKRNKIKARWFVPYFPFARQDRVECTRSAFELKLALDMVKELDIVVADPHSDVTGQLRHIPQSVAVALFREASLIDSGSVNVFAIPDAGASKKAYSWNGGNEVIQCLKKRDTRTGKLSGFKVVPHEDPEFVLYDKRVFIVDDICSAGGTFLGLAQELDRHHPIELNLCITHGLFTFGVGDRDGRPGLASTFDNIYYFGFEEKQFNVPNVHFIPYEDLYRRAAGTNAIL